MAAVTRRRFIGLAAAFGAGATVPSALLATPHTPTRWQGTVLGADASITLAHPNKAKAQRTITQCLKEIERLESMFSLHQKHSALNRLNQHAALENPPAELTELLKIATQYSQQSGGVFDVTIQPLWHAYHEHFKQAGAAPEGPDNHAIKQALSRVNYKHMRITHTGIHMQPGMAITLNGIAQGYITDRVATMLKREGYPNTLINLGEYQALGRHPSGRNWRVAISKPKIPWKLAQELDIPAGCAVATSSSEGTRWSARAHHLLSAQTGKPVKDAHRSITVIAKNATAADALSTVFSLLPGEETKNLAPHFPELVDVISHT